MRTVSVFTEQELISLGGFTGFMCTKKAYSCQKRMQFQKISGFVWIGPKAVELGPRVSNQCFVIGFRYDLKK